MTVLNAATLQMVALGELTWPITYRYRIWTPWGETQQFLSLDVPIFEGLHDQSRDLGLEVWQRSLAVASTRNAELLGWDTMLWKMGLGSIPMLALAGRGLQSGPGTDRRDSGQMVLHTGHMDRYGRRRIPFPAMPLAWVSDGQLTQLGWTALRTIAEGLNIGMQGWTNGAPYQMLIAYPGVLSLDIENPNRVAFRRVTHIRVTQFTDRAPDPSSDWL